MLKGIFKKTFILFLMMAVNLIIISSAYTLLTFSAQGEFKSLGFEPSIQDSVSPITGMYPGDRRTIYEADVDSGTEINAQMSLKIISSGELLTQNNKVKTVPIELLLYIDDAYFTSVDLSTNNILVELPTQTNFTLRVDAYWPLEKPFQEYKGTSGTLGFELTISQ